MLLASARERVGEETVNGHLTEQAPPASAVLTWDEYMDALMKG
ncbi:hypothetical protein ACIA78_38140 [Streptomyces xanthochromogenes]